MGPLICPADSQTAPRSSNRANIVGKKVLRNKKHIVNERIIRGKVVCTGWGPEGT